MFNYNQIYQFLIIIIILISCSSDRNTNQSSQLDVIAEGYVKLVLRIGLYDSDYVDAYYGPEELRPSDSEKQNTFPYSDFNKKVMHLIGLCESIDNNKLVGLEEQRHSYLINQLNAVQAKIEMLNGRQYSFNEESERLYDAVAPVYDESYFQEIISELEEVIPGKGNLSERLNSYRKEFVIPKEKLESVYSIAIAECQKRTLKFIQLPENEIFDIEFVSDKSWGAYNWYKGNYYSLIQINTDLPVQIYRAIYGGAHEGYPGHHVFNTLRENYLVIKKGWLEHTVYPLFSPQSLIAEGTAVFGSELVMPFDQRLTFEREVLFSIAGLETHKVEEYYRIDKLTRKLRYAGNEAARKYLNGGFTEEEAINWLMRYELVSRERALQRLKFIRQYRSYVINYNLGYKIVKDYIESNGGTQDNIELRWKLFSELLSAPLTPSDLIKATKKTTVHD
jgi:hypothetical protein